MRKLTRMESTKEARRVLNRHSVDLCRCQFSCYGHEVRLTGWFMRTDRLDFTGSQIEAMIQDFKRCLPGFLVAGELENWRFTSDHISYLGKKEDSKDSGGEEAQIVYEIELDGSDSKAS